MCPIRLKRILNYFLFVWNVKKLIVAKWSQGSIINISYKKWRTFFRQRKNTNLSNYWHLRRYIDIYNLWKILLDTHHYYLFVHFIIGLFWPCCDLWCWWDVLTSSPEWRGYNIVTDIELISLEEWYQHDERSYLFLMPKYTP